MSPKISLHGSPNRALAAAPGLRKNTAIEHHNHNAHCTSTDASIVNATKRDQYEPISKDCKERPPENKWSASHIEDARNIEDEGLNSFMIFDNSSDPIVYSSCCVYSAKLSWSRLRWRRLELLWDGFERDGFGMLTLGLCKALRRAFVLWD